MKVILLSDVAKIGRKFDLVTVSDGFALNKLIPKNMAQVATPENMKRLQQMSSKLQHDRELATKEFSQTVSDLKDIQVPVAVEASSEGRMFQALKTEQIIIAVKEASGHELHAEQILLKEPIKSLGEHIVSVQSGDVHGELSLNVIAKTK